MINRVIGSVVFLFIFLTCDTKSQHKNVGQSKGIVLINAPFADRCQMGRLVDLVSKQNPKAIGINFLYIGSHGENFCDSLFEHSMRQSGKVILVEGFENDEHVQSDLEFRSAAMNAGLTGLLQSKEGVTDFYYRILDHRGRWEYSFPFLLALKDDTTKRQELATKAQPKDYPLVLNYDLNDFKIVDEGDVVNKLVYIKDKIVIIGDLRSDGDDLFSAPLPSGVVSIVPGTLITANIIADILSEK